MDQVRKMELLKPRIQPVQENELTTQQHIKNAQTTGTDTQLNSETNRNTHPLFSNFSNRTSMKNF